MSAPPVRHVRALAPSDVGPTCDVVSAESVSQTERQQEHPVGLADGPVNVCSGDKVDSASPCASVVVNDKSLYCADMSSAKLLPIDNSNSVVAKFRARPPLAACFDDDERIVIVAPSDSDFGTFGSVQLCYTHSVDRSNSVVSPETISVEKTQVESCADIEQTHGCCKSLLDSVPTLPTEHFGDAFPQIELPDWKRISETVKISPDGFAHDSKQFDWLIRRFSDENLNAYT